MIAACGSIVLLVVFGLSAVSAAGEGLARTGPLIPDWLRWTLAGTAVAGGGVGLWFFLRHRRGL